MDIHNTMEDVVLQYLDELLTLKNNICKCYQCRIDMACYALNKVRPMYVVSSRGVIHTENIKKEHIQDEIDIYATVAEAIDVVSGTRRHEVSERLTQFEDEIEDEIQKYKSDTGCYYNFPQIVGRIFDSNTISKIVEARISLFHGTGKDAIHMFNRLWTNPVDIVSQMKGTYSFWPAPMPAPKPGVQKDFQMNLEVYKEGYEKIRKFFYIRIISSNELRKFITKENIFYIDDIFITPIKEEVVQS